MAIFASYLFVLLLDLLDLIVFAWVCGLCCFLSWLFVSRQYNSVALLGCV